MSGNGNPWEQGATGSGTVAPSSGSGYRFLIAMAMPGTVMKARRPAAPLQQWLGRKQRFSPRTRGCAELYPPVRGELPFTR
ncbi:hypothetical protein HEQ60_03790 [Haematospirillum sp. H1815]|uniref:hypothetical protein n=1 Tax=Haematospirillum sp. H1815 TaxID=2723108 RepID=UPI00143C77A0|nr:hypothetical protein [Haematospirillum sp. H1815]NKD76886.1 hypothetical protein [Haematospirillum sp. H1815]